MEIPYILYGRKGLRSGEGIEIVGNKNVEVPGGGGGGAK